MAGARNSLQEAALLLQRGAVDQALALLTSIVQREPANADAFGLLGIAYATRQDYVPANDALRRALQINPQHAAAHANQGNVLKRLDRLEEAVECFRRAIGLRPDGLATYRQLGWLLLELRRHREAVDLFTRMLERTLRDAIVLNDRGVAYLGLASYQAAIADFDAAIELEPLFAAAWGNKALALLRMGNVRDAQDAIDRALALDENAASTLSLRGEILRRAGRIHDAIASFERACAVDATAWEARCGVGVCYTQTGNFAAAAAALNRAAQLRPDEARIYLERARLARAMANAQAALFDLDNVLKIDPSHVDALVLRAAVQRELGNSEEALADCDRVLAADAANWQAHNNRGVLLDELGRTDEALAALEQSLALNPNNADAYQNIGAMMLSSGRGDEALAKFDLALEADAQGEGICNGKGAVLLAMRRFDEALAAFDKAVALRPDSPISNFHRAFPLLMTGRFTEGFEAYEWRRRGGTPLVDLPRFDRPELEAGEDPKGKRLLMPGEQGLGDVVQFARFARTFAERGAKVILAVNPALQRLLGSLGEDIVVIPPEGPAPAFDATCPLLSAPHRLGLTLETIPSAPYLSAPAELRGFWRRKLAVHPPPRIGIAWSGNPQFVNDRVRSMSFARFESVMDRSRATFVGLQKDVRASDQASLTESGVVDVRHELGDLMDTAALIAELDLVISVDTVIAHLAGALGQRVWILLSAVADWRWLEGRSDSLWYPSARLFRQAQIDAWTPVLAEVRTALAGFEAQSSGQ